MPKMGKSKSKSTGSGAKTVVKGKKSYPGRYGDGLAKEDKIVIKKGPTFSSRYK